MSLFRRKERTWDEIAADPRTPYMVGRLLGANEQAVAILRADPTPQTASAVAETLAHVTGYFLGQITKVEAQHLEDAPTLVIKRPEEQ